MIIKYPDKSSYAEVDLLNDSYTTFRINSYEDLWHLNQYVDACNSIELTPTIVIPNLIDAQADRRFGVNQSYGLKLVCKFLNGMKANFIIFHPHNQSVVEALMDNVTFMSNESFIRDVLQHVTDNDKINVQEDLILMSADAGGFKELMNLCEKLNWKGETYSASKARSYKNGKSELVQVIDRQNFDGKSIMLIDDISIYGGTFKGLANLLHDRNCGKIYLAVSHMTVQDLGDDPVTDYFDQVFTTNSKYDNYYHHDNKHVLIPNLTVYKMF